MSEADVAVLVRRTRLDLSDDEIQWMKTAYAGYHAQLEALMALDLDGDEVGTSFLSGDSL